MCLAFGSADSPPPDLGDGSFANLTFKVADGRPGGKDFPENTEDRIQETELGTAGTRKSGIRISADQDIREEGDRSIRRSGEQGHVLRGKPGFEFIRV